MDLAEPMIGLHRRQFYRHVKFEGGGGISFFNQSIWTDMH